MRLYIALFVTLLLSSCIVVPGKDKSHINKCEISSDKKTLKVIDIAKGTNSYYSVSGLFLFPLSAAVSGTYVAVNNVYHFGEETIVCE